MSSKDLAVSVRGLSKSYVIAHNMNRPTNLREAIVDRFRHPLGKGGQDHELFWAIKNMDFDIRAGEAVGIIGRNGAGKSTLLKILSRITWPTTGEIDIDGRVSSLLEVGTGFHPELTGRENVFLNGSILGMSRREIGCKFDEIVAFSGVEKFLDTPVKRYSSGMYVRLAFAVAAHIDPEILIVDEVLAVGDAAFQKKCLGKMDEVAQRGRTVLLVSHNLGVIQTLCRSVILLAQGEIHRMGPARDVVVEYLSMIESVRLTAIADRADRIGVGRFRFVDLELLDAQGRPCDFVITGEDVGFRMRLKASEDVISLSVPLDISIVIRDAHGNRVTSLSSFFTGSSPTSLEGACEVTCYLPRLPLLAGQYRLDLWCGISEETQDKIWDAAVLRVEQGNYFGNADDVRLPVPELHGCCMIPQIWGGATVSGARDRYRSRCISASSALHAEGAVAEHRPGPWSSLSPDGARTEGARQGQSER